MKNQKKAEEIAVERVQLLSPLLVEGLDPAKMREIKTHLCETHGVSDRTLRRYLEKYRQSGFVGLKPQGKGRKATEVITPELLEQAILLRREVPGRSVAQIIQILEWEGESTRRRTQTQYTPGTLRETRLQHSPDADVC